MSSELASIRRQECQTSFVSTQPHLVFPKGRVVSCAGAMSEPELVGDALADLSSSLTGLAHVVVIIAYPVSVRNP